MTPFPRVPDIFYHYVALAEALQQMLAQVDIRLRIAFTEKAAFYAFERHLASDNVHELLAVSE